MFRLLISEYFSSHTAFSLENRNPRNWKRKKGLSLCIRWVTSGSEVPVWLLLFGNQSTVKTTSVPAGSEASEAHRSQSRRRFIQRQAKPAQERSECTSLTVNSGSLVLLMVSSINVVISSLTWFRLLAQLS